MGAFGMGFQAKLADDVIGIHRDLPNWQENTAAGIAAMPRAAGVLDNELYSPDAAT
jgi:hypothetical protein